MVDEPFFIAFPRLEGLLSTDDTDAKLDGSSGPVMENEASTGGVSGGSYKFWLGST
jgi:hypothetical protein